MDSLRHRLDSENAELFLPYIGALESLKESIDLEHLATFGMEELSDLRLNWRDSTAWPSWELRLR